MKKKTKHEFIFLFIFIQIFQFGSLSFYPQNRDKINEKSVNINNNIQKPQSGNDLQSITLNYSLKYDITKNGESTNDIIPISLLINGTKGLYENGTITYFIGKNITDQPVLQLFSSVFFEEQLEFFQNHLLWQPLNTCFSYRKEAISINPENFETNASYTMFWLNISTNEEGYIRENRNIKFLDVNAPFYLPIFDENRILAEKSWSDEPSALRKNVRLIESFHLKSNINNEQIVNLYYDKTWTILLQAEFEFNNADDEIYTLEISLENTNLNLDYMSTNPYWEVRLRNLLITIPLIAIPCIILITYLFRLKKKKPKKENLLNKI